MPPEVRKLRQLEEENTRLRRAGRRSDARQRDAAGGDPPQTMTPARGREMIDFVRTAFQVSIRRACRTVPVCRATYHYRKRPLGIREIAETRMRYGYRRITVLLRREGWHVNAKRIHRFYRLEGLQIRLKPPRRRVMAKLRDDRSNATGGGRWTGCTMNCSMGAVSGFSPSWIYGAGCARSYGSADRRLRWRSSMRLSRLDNSMACQRRSVSTREVSSRRRSSIYGPMRTASRCTSAAQASRPTTRAWKASTPRFGSSASVGTGILDLEDARKRLKNAVPSTSAHRNTYLSMSLKRTGFADRDAIPRGVLGSGVRVR